MNNRSKYSSTNTSDLLYGAPSESCSVATSELLSSETEITDEPTLVQEKLLIGDDAPHTECEAVNNQLEAPCVESTTSEAAGGEIPFADDDGAENAVPDVTPGVWGSTTGGRPGAWGGKPSAESSPKSRNSRKNRRNRKKKAKKPSASNASASNASASNPSASNAAASNISQNNDSDKSSTECSPKEAVPEDAKPATGQTSPSENNSVENDPSIAMDHIDKYTSDTATDPKATDSQNQADHVSDLTRPASETPVVTQESSFPVSQMKEPHYTNSNNPGSSDKSPASPTPASDSARPNQSTSNQSSDPTDHNQNADLSAANNSNHTPIPTKVTKADKPARSASDVTERTIITPAAASTVSKSVNSSDHTDSNKYKKDNADARDAVDAGNQVDSAPLQIDPEHVTPQINSVDVQIDATDNEAPPSTSSTWHADIADIPASGEDDSQDALMDHGSHHSEKGV